MYSLGRALTRTTTQSLKRVVATSKPAAFNMSTLLDRREHAEESKYIREQENRRKEELRAKLEAIIALEDHHEDKQELVELLNKDQEEKTLLGKLGLNDWKFAVPAGLLVGIPALANEVIVLDAEMQLSACFVLFCSTMYTQVGPMLGKTLDDYGKEVHNELKNLDKAFQSQIKTAIDANQQALTLAEDFKQLYSLSDSLAVAQAEVLNNQEEHKYREAIVKKLDSLYALEEAASSAIRNRTLTAVKSSVIDTFTNDKKAQEAALNQAIAVLSAGAGAKIGKDVVGEVFAASLNKYKTDYAKLPAGSDEILANLEKEIAVISQAPVVEGKGGNVYITHPLA